MLVGPDGKVLFWETEFDEAGFSTAIEKLYSKTAEAQPDPVSAERSIRRAGPSEAASIVILGGGASEGSWPQTICAGGSRRNTASS